MGFTARGAEMARLAGRLGSLDAAAADAGVLEWAVGAARRLRGMIDACEAQVTFHLESSLRRGVPVGGVDGGPTSVGAGGAGATAEADSAGASAGGADGADGADGAEEGAPCLGDGGGALGAFGAAGAAGGGPSVRESAEELRVRLVRARWVRRLPGFGAALEAGQITAGHVDVLAAVLDRVEPTVVAEVVADEAEVLEVAQTGSRSSFGRWLRLRVDRVRADGGRRRLERQVEESFGSLKVDDELGLHRLFVQLDPVRGGRVASAVRQRVEELQQSGVVEGWRRGQVIAQAVTDLVCGDVTPRAGGAEVLVVADLVTLLEGHHEGSVCETDDGLALPVETVRDLCRQAATALTVAVRDPAGITVAVGRHRPPTAGRSPGPPGRPSSGAASPAEPTRDPPGPHGGARIERTSSGAAPTAAGGTPRTDAGRGPGTNGLARLVSIALGRAGPEALNAGRRIRLANWAQRRALRAMYRGCAHPDCRMPFADCAIHHVAPWESGGATDLANLLPLCGSHHHSVHDGGWRLTIDADRTLRWRRPGDRLDTTPFRSLGATATARGRPLRREGPGAAEEGRLPWETSAA